MSISTLFTADQLLAMPTGMGHRYELVAGELRIMSPSGWRHGKIISRLNSRLEAFVDANKLGMVLGAETGFRLAINPDTVLAPDVSFVSKQRIPNEEPKDSFWPGAPDLAIEVLSPGDRTGEVDDKINQWLSAGCATVWVVNPKLRTITIYWPMARAEVKTIGDVLVGDPVLPGFTFPVEELFR